MADTFRVTIDRDGCISCAVCWTTCPEFFEANLDDDRSQVIEQYRIRGDNAEGAAPDDLLDCVRQAADDCPVEVIHVG